MAASTQMLDRTSLLSGVRILARRDPRLRRLVARHGIPPLWARRPGYASLLRIILEQQVSLASAQAIYHRVALAVGEVSPPNVLALGMTGLQAIGLTRQKASYACAVADHVVRGELELSRLGRYADEAAREHLMKVPGIGPWTSSIYLLMVLGRPDIWPPGDLALHKALGRLHASRMCRHRPKLSSSRPPGDRCGQSPPASFGMLTSLSECSNERAYIP